MKLLQLATSRMFTAWTPSLVSPLPVSHFRGNCVISWWENRAGTDKQQTQQSKGGKRMQATRGGERQQQCAARCGIQPTH